MPRICHIKNCSTVGIFFAIHSQSSKAISSFKPCNWNTLVCCKVYVCMERGNINGLMIPSTFVYSDLFCSHHGHTVAVNSTWSTLLTCTTDNVLDCTMFPHRTCSCVTPGPNGITGVAAIVSSFLQCVVWQLVSSVAVSIGSLLIPPLARFARFCHINCTRVSSAKPELFKAPGANCNHQRDVSLKKRKLLDYLL